MTQFNPQGKKRLTHGECLDPIFKITDKTDALQYKRAYVDYIQNDAKISREEALKIANSNIGYFAGYGSNDDRARIEELFECAHPIFGDIKGNGAPTPAQAFAMGTKMAQEK